MAIGETSYYFEQTNQLINSGLNNNILQSGQWKSTDANLSVSIKPFVSTDENVTLNIVVEKSSFLGRAGETAPPGKATQKFESLVRVKNNEMVLLGGLDELQKDLNSWLNYYNNDRTHTGKYCYGKTPMQTFLDTLPMAREKLIDQQSQPVAVAC